MEENYNEVVNNPNEVLQEKVQPVLTNNKSFAVNRKDSVFKLIFCIASVILAVFGIWGGFRGGFTVSTLILFSVMTVYFTSKKTRLSIFPLFCGLLNCGLSACFVITSNGGIRFLSVVCMILLSAVWFLSLVKAPEKESDFALISNIVIPIVKSATVNLPKTVVAFFSSRTKKRKNFGKVLLGIVLSIPVLVVVVPLLMLSDAAFTGLVNKLLGNCFLNIFKISVGLLIAVFLISYCFTLKKNELSKAKVMGFVGIDNTIVISFLSVLSICYFTYLFSQLAYFFSAFKGILPKDYSFTVAAYARRGFFEMSIIAVINFIIIFTVLILSQKKNGKICVISRALCTFVGFFTLVIIATALSKMFLYIKSYGMTELRITTSAFMIFLAIVFISVMLRVFITRIRVFKTAIVTAACVLVVLGTVNVNNVIASYNYNAYKVGDLKEIDVRTIYKLGDEGIPYLVKLTTDKNTEVAEEAKEHLKNILLNEKYYELEREEEDGVVFWERGYKISGKKYDGIGQYSITRSNAYNALEKYIEENPDVLK